MTHSITTIAFDADDTLWHNERFFKLTQDHFASLLADYVEGPDLMGRLLEAERRNILHYGFGIKGFVLSMIETALDITDGRVPQHVIRDLIETGKEMLAHPIELLPHAREAVEIAKVFGRVLIITKGDLLHQERKVAQSGLGELFDGVEIVSDKVAKTYTRIFDAVGDGAARGMMIGNSMKSDVRPMIDAGGWGVFVPHDLSWDIEHAEEPTDHPRFRKIDDLGQLPDLLSDLSKTG
ncbi:HAD family hydrolase [Ascidiaceihabitans sp.]|uniref:HAD family hydrolase n=1 Tax=Ascidiaceihabitans sp. TaxID=1872644 RepID=UPI003296F7E8